MSWKIVLKRQALNVMVHMKIVYSCILCVYEMSLDWTRLIKTSYSPC